MPIFSDDLLNDLAQEALSQIEQDLQCIYYRFGMSTIVGTSVYTLPSYVRSVKRVTWLGKKLDPVSFQDMMLLTPATAGGFYDNTTTSRPLYYCMHPTNVYDIRFFPTPDMSFTGGENPDPYAPGFAGCIISCWRTVGEQLVTSLPVYIQRRTQKAYILWKAFENEGKGQNLTASAYYKQKYDFLIEQFKIINNNAYIAKRYALGEGAPNTDTYRYPKPFLPSNFEREIFK